MKKTLYTLTALGLALCAATAQAQDRSDDTFVTPIVLDAPAGIGSGGIVSGGIPLPQDLGVTDVSQLRVLARDANGVLREVPSQFDVRSRWNGTVDAADESVRWVFASFVADVGTEYELHVGGATRTRTAAIASEDRNGVTIDTGTLRFRIPRDRFRPLGGLTRSDGETPLIADSGLDAVLVNVEDVDPDGDGFTELVDRKYRLSNAAPSEVVVEENGPLRTVVRLAGTWEDEDGNQLLEGWGQYTLRVIAERGADEVELRFTLENNGLYGPPADHSITRVMPKWMHIRRLNFYVPTQWDGDTTVSTSDGAWGVTAGAPGTDFRLLQTHEVRDRDNESRNFTYRIHGVQRDTNGEYVQRLLTQGARSDGGVAVRTSSGSVVAGLQHFWQNYPKAMSFDDGILAYELFPKEPGLRYPEEPNGLNPRYGDAYRFEGGRHKTYVMQLAFPANGTETVANREGAFQHPPRIVLSPDWVTRTAALGAFSRPGLPFRNRDLTLAAARLERMQKAMVDVDYAERQAVNIPASSIVTQREMRGNALPSSPYDLDLYGYMNFGDLPHFAGYCSLHYDWPRAMFTAYLAHGKREFVDLGVEMLRHRYDIDQYHNEDRTDPDWTWYNGLQRYEYGYHGRLLAEKHPHGEWTPDPQHTWLEGLLLGYALTGDRKALEAARENAEALVDFFTHNKTYRPEDVRGPLYYYGELRAMGRAVEQLLAFYEFTGETKYWEMAYRIFEDGILYAEEYYGNNGFFQVGYDERGDRQEAQELFPVVDLMRPMIRMHQVSQDPRALAVLLRVLNWVKTEGYRGSGRMVLDKYLPLQLPFYWVKRGRQVAGENWFLEYNHITTDAYAYAYLQTGVEDYLGFARRLFRDANLYYYAPMNQPLPADWYHPISYASKNFPGAETKPNCWMLYGHHWYLTAEKVWHRRHDGEVRVPQQGFYQGVPIVEVVRQETTRTHTPRATATPDYKVPDQPTTTRVEVERPAPAGGLRVVKARAETTPTGVLVHVTTSAETIPYLRYRRVGGDGFWRHVASPNGPSMTHVFALPALDAGVDYEVETGVDADRRVPHPIFVVRSRGSDVATESAPPPAPLAIDLGRTSAGRDSAVVRFGTSRSVVPYVRYRVEGSTGAWIYSRVPPQAATNHTVRMGGLTPGTRYEVEVGVEGDGMNAASTRLPILETSTAGGSGRTVEPPTRPDVGADAGPVELAPTDPRRDLRPDDVVLDDAEAELDGPWTTDKNPLALDREFLVAASATRDATATFVYHPDRSGIHRIYMWWPKVSGAAPSARFEVRDIDGIATYRVNQTVTSGRWRLVCEANLSINQPLQIKISNFGAEGAVVLDALKLSPVDSAIRR